MSQSFCLNNLPRTLSLERLADEAVLSFVDQRALPQKLIVKQARTSEQVIDAIKTLAVRGAPALGVAGAAGLALWVQTCASAGFDARACSEQLDSAAAALACARPTAVNLSWGVNRSLQLAKSLLSTGCSLDEVAQRLFGLVAQMEAEDEQCNRAIGQHGAALLKDNTRVLTHCNAGSLATVFYGTALGVVYAAAQEGKIAHVYADETRPVGQGARLTVWELSQVGIPATLICDNMAASLMASGAVDAVIVGADRIAANGDVANKIGTYGVAILAHEHGIPFYVAAPLSTIDASIPDGAAIPIEQRDASEVASFVPAGVKVWNPAFDVTPWRYVTGIITERGVFDPQNLIDELKG